MDMTKFESEDDPGFIAVTGEIHRWLKQLRKGDTAKGTEGEGQHASNLPIIGPGSTDFSSRAALSVVGADSYPTRSV
jgi:hypothetical protein